MAKYLLAVLLFVPMTIKVDKVPNLYTHSAVYKQIRRIKPDIEPRLALEVTEAVYKACGTFKVNPRLLVAILMQESKFDPKAVNKVTHDYGLAQINIKTAKSYKFDLKRLKTEPKYSIFAAGLILNDF